MLQGPRGPQLTLHMKDDMTQNSGGVRSSARPRHMEIYLHSSRHQLCGSTLTLVKNRRVGKTRGHSVWMKLKDENSSKLLRPKDVCEVSLCA